MRAQLSASATRRTVGVAAAVCVAGALIAVAVFSVLGRPASGGALAVGLILGAGNGLLAARLINLPLPFVASSLLRLVTLSMIGVAIGFALGLANIWLVILGLGASQFVLAASAVRQLVQRP